MNAIAATIERMPGSAARQGNLSLTYHRLMLVMLVFAGVTALVTGRLLYLQMFTDRSSGGQVLNPLVPVRGDIVDRNGVPLAQTIDAWSIAIHPNRLLGNPDELAVKLNQLIPDHSIDEYRRVL